MEEKENFIKSKSNVNFKNLSIEYDKDPVDFVLIKFNLIIVREK